MDSYLRSAADASFRCLVMLKICIRGLTDALVLLFPICVWFPECVCNNFIMLLCFININSIVSKVSTIWHWYKQD